MPDGVTFRLNNEILYRAPIVHGEWAAASSSVAVDVIDLNHDGTADSSMGPRIGGGVSIRCKEPALQLPLARLREQAMQRGTDVLTQDEVYDLNVQQVAVGCPTGAAPALEDSPPSGWGTRPLSDHQPWRVDSEVRSIRTVLAELTPFEKGARWAIDAVRGEFLIYRPRH